MAQNVTNAADYKNKKKPYELVVSENLTVLMRRVDMVGMIMSGSVPLSLMNAVDKFASVRDQITDDTSPDEAVKLLEGAGEGGEFRKFLEHYASYAVIQPKIVVADASKHRVVADDELDAHEIELMELMAIWNSTPPGDNPAPEVLEPLTFRAPEPSPPNPSVPDVGEVRETAVMVVEPKSEFKYQ